ncbi:MAG: hypothetical protein Q7T82_14705 [Armatimonadota bacterium]|nr:hypothetical protein [Armatimonadota bacterium]
MKWRNIDVGQGYYDITGTITEWLPVRRGLVSQPADWPYSSYRFYEIGEECGLCITPVEP